MATSLRCHKLPIYVAAAAQNLQTQAKALATRLALPYSDVVSPQYSFTLVVTPTGLELRTQANRRLKPLKVDFLSGALAHRHRYGGGKQQLLAKAVGLNRHAGLNVLDITAGLARDGFILASLGAQVILLERSPIVAALLQDGLQRAQQAAWFRQLHLQLQLTDASNYLKQLTPSDYPDVIYCDPMYTARQKSALVKKDLRILRQLVGHDEDADTLLPLVLTMAKKRVVVKRHKQAPPLAKLTPDHQLIGAHTRFDIYYR